MLLTKRKTTINRPRSKRGGGDVRMGECEPFTIARGTIKWDRCAAIILIALYMV